MIVSFRKLLKQAGDHGVGAFTCYDLETVGGVLGAAADTGQGVILLISSSTFASPDGGAFLAAVRVYAEQGRAAACVQLDHVSDLALIRRAFEVGAGAVMADGSRLSLEDNIELVRAAADVAARTGGAVEAELGTIEGDEDIATAAAAGRLTDPDQAKIFAERSRCDCLAISIGNVHGTYASSPRLDWERLQRIRAQVDIPLALHGASGLSDADVSRGIASGIRKVNVNTELRQAYIAATSMVLDEVTPGSSVRALHAEQRDAVDRVVREKLAVLARLS